MPVDGTHTPVLDVETPITPAADESIFSDSADTPVEPKTEAAKVSESTGAKKSSVKIKAPTLRKIESGETTSSVQTIETPKALTRKKRPALVANDTLSNLEREALSLGAFVTFDSPGANAVVGHLINVEGWMIHHPYADTVVFEVNGCPITSVRYFKRDDVVAEHQSYETSGFEFWVDTARALPDARNGIYLTARCGGTVVQKLYMKFKPETLAEQAEREIVYFIHTPKTGGTSVAQMIDDHAASIKTLKAYDEIGYISPSDVSQLSDAALAHVDLVYGHFGYGVHGTSKRPFKYCTLIRDPYDFLMSQYFFAKYTQKLPEYTNCFSIDEFMDANPHAFDNSYCRFLCGDVPEHVFIDDTHYERAIATIERDFFFVGVTERLQESLCQIGKRLGVDFSGRTYRSNVTPLSIERNTINMAAVRKNHHARVQYDLKLYAYVMNRFFGYPAA